MSEESSSTTPENSEQPNQGPPTQVFWTSRRFTVLMLAIALIVGLVVGAAVGFGVGSNQADSVTQATGESSDGAAIIGPDFNESKRYCPEPGSADELKTPKTDKPLKIDGITEQNFLVMSDHPVVHIISSAAPAGLIRLCGGPGIVVMSGVHWGLQLHFGDYRARVIVVDPIRADSEHFDPAKVSVADGIPVEVIYCTTKGASDLRPCSSLNLH